MNLLKIELTFSVCRPNQTGFDVTEMCEKYMNRHQNPLHRNSTPTMSHSNWELNNAKHLITYLSIFTMTFRHICAANEKKKRRI